MARWTMVLLLAAGATLVGGCSGSGGGDGIGGRGVGDLVLDRGGEEERDLAPCDALRAIADLDLRAGEITTTSDWSEVQAFMAEQLPQAAERYDQAADAIPQLADSLAAMRDLALQTVDVFAAANSVQEAEQALVRVEGIGASIDAALEIDAYAQGTCGFSVSNS